MTDYPTAATRLDSARATLLAPADLDLPDLGRALGQLASDAIDIADVFVERTLREDWSFRDGRVAGGSYDVSQGLGVRAVIEDRTAFGYAGEITSAGLMRAVAAAGAVRGNYTPRADVGPARPLVAGRGAAALYPAASPIDGFAPDAKTALLALVDETARAIDPAVIQVDANLVLRHSTVLLATDRGEAFGDLRPRAQLYVSVVVERNGRRASGMAGAGARGGAAMLDPARARAIARSAVDRALTALDARPAPSGPTTVVLGPGYPGVLFHEALGHTLEADFNRKGLSPFSNRIGERVAPHGVSVIDDGSVPELLGSSSIDDEGSATRPTTLIEDGILKGYLQDRLNARLMNRLPTGNGRRASYADLPMPRMTNTFLRGGDHDPAEIIASVKSGIYATDFEGGRVEIASGQFNFSTSAAWLIEDGRITAPIAGATLVGSGATSLQQIRMLGNDFAFDEGIASCSKDGITLPVTVGQPTLRIDDMVVGGRA